MDKWKLINVLEQKKDTAISFATKFEGIVKNEEKAIYWRSRVDAYKSLIAEIKANPMDKFGEE